MDTPVVLVRLDGVRHVQTQDGAPPRLVNGLVREGRISQDRLVRIGDRNGAAGLGRDGVGQVEQVPGADVHQGAA